MNATKTTQVEEDINNLKTTVLVLVIIISGQLLFVLYLFIRVNEIKRLKSGHSGHTGNRPTSLTTQIPNNGQGLPRTRKRSMTFSIDDEMSRIHRENVN